MSTVNGDIPPELEKRSPCLAVRVVSAISGARAIWQTWIASKPDLERDMLFFFESVALESVTLIIIFGRVILVEFLEFEKPLFPFCGKLLLEFFLEEKYNGGNVL